MEEIKIQQQPKAEEIIQPQHSKIKDNMMPSQPHKTIKIKKEIILPDPLELVNELMALNSKPSNTNSPKSS